MTAHELAKKLLDMPDVEVVYDDDYYGEQTVESVKIKVDGTGVVVELSALM